MSEVIFIVEEAAEGGYTARALGRSIFTEADTLPDLHERLWQLWGKADPKRKDLGPQSRIESLRARALDLTASDEQHRCFAAPVLEAFR
jgi:hypothetical protein